MHLLPYSMPHRQCLEAVPAKARGAQSSDIFRVSFSVGPSPLCSGSTPGPGPQLVELNTIKQAVGPSQESRGQRRESGCTLSSRNTT